jgi:hypothetical protein
VQVDQVELLIQVLVLQDHQEQVQYFQQLQVQVVEEVDVMLVQELLEDQVEVEVGELLIKQEEQVILRQLVRRKVIQVV